MIIWGPPILKYKNVMLNNNWVRQMIISIHFFDVFIIFFSWGRGVGKRWNSRLKYLTIFLFFSSFSTKTNFLSGSCWVLAKKLASTLFWSLGLGAGKRAKTLWGRMGSTLSSEDRWEWGLAGWPTLTRGPETSLGTFWGFATNLTYEVEVVGGEGGSKIWKVKLETFCLLHLLVG